MPRGFPHHNPYKKFGGPWKRLHVLQSLVQALIQYERIETTFAKASEAQKYMERLIDVAKYGESDAYCKDMLKFWAPDVEDRNKLFNVLIPRYSQHEGKYTRLARLPDAADKFHTLRKMAVIELKGNILPPLPIKEKNPHTLQNVLIAAAKADWQRQKESAQDIEQKMQIDNDSIDDVSSAASSQ